MNVFVYSEVISLKLKLLWHKAAQSLEVVIEK